MTASTSFDPGPNAGLINVAGSRSGLSTPALVLDLDALDRNIERMARFTRTAGVSVRPHSKGSKSLAIVRRQIEAGAIGVCCTTIGEAEVMAAGGVANILITSPIVSPPMIARLIALNESAEGLMVVVDDARNVEALSRAIGAGKPLGVLVEVDVGQGRTGVVGEDNVVALIRRVAATPELTYRGIQAYYGHLQHVPTIAERLRVTEPKIAQLRQLLDRLGREGLTPAIVTGSGTGTFETDAATGVFTEFQAGSYPFMDREYVEIERGNSDDVRFEPALFVQATVVNASRPGFVVVNAGYKSFATEGGPPVVARPDLPGATYQLMGDEHGGVTFDPGKSQVGLSETIEFLAPHCDPTINLYDRYHCVRGDTLVDIWPVDGRGR